MLKKGGAAPCCGGAAVARGGATQHRQRTEAIRL